MVLARNLAHSHMCCDFHSVIWSFIVAWLQNVFVWISEPMGKEPYVINISYIHRKDVFVNIFGRMCFYPQNMNLIMLLCIVVTWLIAQWWGEGAKSTMSIRRQVREKEGEDWFEPVFNIYTPLSPTVTPVFVFVTLQLSSKKKKS